jgi:hypothetical protein
MAAVEQQRVKALGVAISKALEEVTVYVGRTVDACAHLETTRRHPPSDLAGRDQRRTLRGAQARHAVERLHLLPCEPSESPKADEDPSRDRVDGYAPSSGSQGQCEQLGIRQGARTQA